MGLVSHDDDAPFTGVDVVIPLCALLLAFRDNRYSWGIYYTLVLALG